MRLRFALVSDLPEMQKLYAETIQAICIDDYNQQQIDVWKATAQNAERWRNVVHEQLAIVAEKNRKVIGFGTLKDGNYIDFFYVHKDFQGQGIACKILSQLETQAIKSGNFNLTSDVSITAKPFFEKKGFLVIREQRNFKKGVELINYKMSKTL